MAWFDYLQPASFNGAPFFVESTEKQFGRRLVSHEFPLRDDPSLEDLGRLPRGFTVKAYLVGDNFIRARDRLETALESSAGVGTLVHPTYGILKVWVGVCRSSEARASGSYASIEIAVTLDGGNMSPISVTDTASTVLQSLNEINGFLQAAYVAAVQAGTALAVVRNVLRGNFFALNGLLGGLPQFAIFGLAGQITASVSDAVGTALAISGLFSAIADNVVAAQPGLPGNTPVSGYVPALPATDPAAGLAGLAGFGATLMPVAASALPDVGQAQTAFITLVQGCALTAVIVVYANTDWVSAAQAQASAAQLQGLLDIQVAAAADAGNYDLFRAWRATSAQAMADMATRAQSLPTLAPYAVAGVVPALALAQLLYLDATQADSLVALNNVAHPLFMPPAGQWLQAA